MTDDGEWWVFSEKPGLLAELIGGARALAAQTGGEVAAIVFGPRPEAEQAAARGADRVLWLGEPAPDQLVDEIVPSLAQLAAARRPRAILIGATRRGKAVAGRLAARLNLSAITDVKELAYEEGSLRARHLIFGGGAVRVEQPRAGLLLATAGQGIFEALPARAGGPAEIVPAPFVDPGWRLKLRERKERPISQVNLNAARRVVCAGRGVARQEDLALLEDLARALGAEIACTRPLAEGLNWLPRERYIGVSGANIHPDLYFGVGVSGQVQHTVGMSESRVVAAVNKDRNAPIFQQADYAVVGDLYALVPELIKALKGRK